MGYLLSTNNLIDLWKTLSLGKPSQFMRDLYNTSTANSFDEFAYNLMVQMLSLRDDTDYWRYF